MKHNNKYNYQKQFKSLPSKQGGIALLGLVLVLLVVVGLLSMTSAKNTVLETKMVFNLQDKQRSILAADSAAQYAWEQVKKDADIKKVINNGNDGYYILGDAITAGVGGGTKIESDWDNNENVVSWPWQDSNQRFEIPAQLGGTSNPMKLIDTPQYTVGMHNSVIRKGTSNYRCLPISIIGASQGGTTQTRTLIELKTIPKSTCFHEKIK